MPDSTTVATTATALTVVVGVVFGVLTLRQWQHTRYLTAAAELVHTIQTPEFNRSIALLMELPENAPADRVLGDRETTAALYAIAHVFESLGVLVYHRLLPLHLVDHLVGGYARASWRRVGAVVQGRRGTLGAMFGEWYQWLVERMEQYPAPGKSEGAAQAFASWRP